MASTRRARAARGGTCPAATSTKARDAGSADTPPLQPRPPKQPPSKHSRRTASPAKPSPVTHPKPATARPTTRTATTHRRTSWTVAAGVRRPRRRAESELGTGVGSRESGASRWRTRRRAAMRASGCAWRRWMSGSGRRPGWVSLRERRAKRSRARCFSVLASRHHLETIDHSLHFLNSDLFLSFSHSSFRGSSLYISWSGGRTLRFNFIFIPTLLSTSTSISTFTPPHNTHSCLR